MLSDDEVFEIGSALEHSNMSDDEIDTYLEHYGVKGMKWGVRRERRASTFNRARQKDGPRVSKVKAGLTTGPIDLVKGRGFRGGAERKYQRLTSRNARVQSGKSSAMDKLKYYGSQQPQDFIPVQASKANNKTTVKRDATMLAAGGAIFALNVLKYTGKAKLS